MRIALLFPGLIMFFFLAGFFLNSVIDSTSLLIAVICVGVFSVLGYIDHQTPTKRKYLRAYVAAVIVGVIVSLNVMK